MNQKTAHENFETIDINIVDDGWSDGVDVDDDTIFVEVYKFSLFTLVTLKSGHGAKVRHHSIHFP